MSWDQITHIILQFVLFRGQHVLGSLPVEAPAPSHSFNERRASLWISHCFPTTLLLMGIYSFSNFSTAISVAMITGHLHLCEHV